MEREIERELERTIERARARERNNIVMKKEAERGIECFFKDYG